MFKTKHGMQVEVERIERPDGPAVRLTINGMSIEVSPEEALVYAAAAFYDAFNGMEEHWELGEALVKAGQGVVES